ncbi:right-handed parallel beta-helix repeat-containing protein [Luteipulveratus sp. YIM 133132]|uniref:right-handed parallel beta-helix repeat-containing protein n=1 Tax=Luteipulveratus flavus TaxID=3031728 RepID=UPI0023B0AB6C|nr:right-handed parallel beta-helix repeat-containing protein [Luteipulveratus sp. YIM 133132]MDE9364990.1 right-handed parallel beta-helix repeat-containing protein [Luteipulveratus sp. YIM 133132]
MAQIVRSSPVRRTVNVVVPLLLVLTTAAWGLSAPASAEMPAQAVGRAVASGPLPTSLGLDESGRTLPDTAYAIPTGATYLSTTGNDAASGRTPATAVRTLNRAIDVTPAGGTVVVRGGEYRDWYHSGSAPKVVPKPVHIQAYPHEKPWFTGADLRPRNLWSKIGDRLWATPWVTPWLCGGQYYWRWLYDQGPNGPCAHQDNTNNPSNVMAVDPQMAFVDGAALRQVPASRPQRALAAGTFAYDRSAGLLYVAADPAVHRLELSVRPTALVLGGGGSSSLKGVGFRRYASNQYENLTSAAVYIGGSISSVERAVFAENAAGGLTYSNPKKGSAITGSVLANNGFTALQANGTSRSNIDNDFRVVGNVFNHNNAEGFGERCTSSCAQAAVKLAHMQGATISRNIVKNTVGPRGAREGYGNGLWCDGLCRRTSYTYNLVTGNPGVGIFHEVSDSGIIAGNVITSSQNGIGVASASTKVYNNTLVGNVQGMKIYDDRRSSSTDSGVGPDTTRVAVADNLVVGNGLSFGIEDHAIGIRPGTDVKEYFSAMSDNSCHQRNGTAPKFAFVQSPDRAGRYYGSLAAFQTDWGLGARSHWISGSADPFFVNETAGDYRVRVGSVAKGSATPLPADVAAALGVPAAGPRDRGALSPP